MTDLANQVQPIIRYDQGDSVPLRPDAYPCGSTLPAIRVVGRTNDTLSFPSGLAASGSCSSPPVMSSLSRSAWRRGAGRPLIDLGWPPTLEVWRVRARRCETTASIRRERG
jgi:hypothetical protein